MKKNMRFLVLALAIAVTLLGAGYAAWDSTIVDNTSLQSGKFDVKFCYDVDNHSLVASDSVDLFYKGGVVKSGVDEDTKNENELVGVPDFADGDKLVQAKVGSNYIYTIAPTFADNHKTVNFKFLNMHPGSTANTYFEIRNFGTIPAKCDNITVAVTGATGSATLTQAEQELFAAMVVNGEFLKHQAGPNNNTFIAVGAPLVNIPLAGLEAALETRLIGNTEPQILKPSEYLNVSDFGSGYPTTINGSDEEETNALSFSIPMAALQSADGVNLGMGATLNIKITMDYVQYNVDVIATAPL